MVLVTTTPLWVALFSWIFLGLAPSFTVLLGVIIAVLGGALIGFGDLGGGSAPLLGDSLALIGAVCASAYLLLGRSAQRRGLSLQAYIGVAYGVAALVLLPLPLLFNFSYTGYSSETLFWIALLALVPQLIGHTSFNYVVKTFRPDFCSDGNFVGAGGLELLSPPLVQRSALTAHRVGCAHSTLRYCPHHAQQPRRQRVP